jgi:TonB family protein
MKHLRLKITIIAGGIAMLASIPAWGESVKIIVNNGVQADQISVRDLKSVFLRERNSLSDGTHVEPVLERGGSAHQAFLKLYLKQDNDELLRYYQSLVFTGKGSMPKAVGSDEEAVAYVAKTKGAIGYISAESSAVGVKTLAVVDASNNAYRRLITWVSPVYPEQIHQKYIGGIVRLKITISAKGDVQDVQILGGNPIFAEAAVAAAEKWKYEAGSSPTTMEVSIPFDVHQ